ncbi:efflux transporter outer membrane subunit [Variovorax ginsengisoli]|uniref:Multidrug efflux system outer membrane protein n=1 Tax=Variovorax ginsengisoli TaxID=363844 RepID=A0ABT9S9K5_9BURK|nr:efflux transporter outer membrane subunit [Variovorax ginsengisoli]MDP9900890.1 multidrug efflux system outer membrane protein [Variovorax ginsengisoli]
MNRRLLPLAMATALLSACSSMAPPYQQPAAPVPTSWPQGTAYAPTSEGSAADIPWQSFVMDERLRQVIAQALANSRDLRETVASIESARAQYQSQRAASVPTVNAGVSGTKSRSTTSDGNGGLTTVRSQSTSAELSISSYELDLFGKVRSQTNAALETYLKSEEASRATRISLIAETINAWMTLGSDRSLLAIARQTQESSQRSMDVARKRLELGVTSRVDLRQAETVYQQARADVASSLTQIAQDRNALELLTGSPVADALLPDDLPESAVVLADVPAGLSSDVLLQRPDVLEAEHQLKSANANIGAARAAFFPSLTLTASGGLSSAALAGLFSGGAAGVWSLAPSLSVPIFDGGANRANLAYYEAQQKYYLSAYELAIQTAFKEVADALAQRGTMAEQLAAQAALVEASSDSYKLADARYRSGVDTFLNSLDSQRTLYSAQKTLTSLRLTALENRVTLYRVLGGGIAG